jgi:hypothetical protein
MVQAQDFVHTFGSLLQTWQLLSSFCAILVFCVVTGGLIWRMRTEGRVVESVKNVDTPPVLQRLNANSATELPPDAKKIAALASLARPIAPPTRSTSGD